MNPAASTITFDRSDRGLIVSICGELDVANAPGFSQQIREQARSGATTIWLDLSGVSFCASAGVSLIIRAEHDATEHGGQLVLLNPSDPITRILDMCNLTSLATIRVDRMPTITGPAPVIHDLDLGHGPRPHNDGSLLER